MDNILQEVATKGIREGGQHPTTGSNKRNEAPWVVDNILQQVATKETRPQGWWTTSYNR